MNTGNYRLLFTRYILAGMCSLLFLSPVGEAQEKATPSPSPMPLPSDSVRADSLLQKPKTEPQKPELELPEVLILGQNRTVRLREGKEQRVPDNPQLVKPNAPSESVDTWFQLQEEKPEMQTTAAGINRLTWAGLRGGTYSTFDGGLGHWQQMDKTTVSGRAWADRSDGQYVNSQYSRGGLAANATFDFSQYFNGTVAGEAGLYRRGLHGALFPAVERNARMGDIGTSLQYTLSQNATGQFGLEFGGLNIQSDSSETKLDATNNTWFAGTGDFTAQFSKMQISLSARYLNEQLKTDFVDEASLSFGAYGIEMLLPVSDAMSSILGVKYETVLRDTLDVLTRVSPYGRVNLTPNNRVGLTLMAYTGYQYESYLQRWEENPYLSHTISMYPAEVDWGAGIEVNIAAMPGVNILGRVNQSSMKNTFYWQRDITTGFFDLRETENTEIVDLEAGVHFNPVDWLSLRGSVKTYVASFTQEDTLLSDKSYLPYRPQFRLPAEVSITMPLDFQFQLDGEFIGKRRINFASQTKLDAVGLLNASLEKDFGEHFSSSLNILNLLDSEYVYWQFYPEPGRQVFLGLRAKF